MTLGFGIFFSLKDQTVLKRRTILGERWYIHLVASQHSQQLYIVLSAFNSEGWNGHELTLAILKTNGWVLLSIFYVDKWH